MRLKALARSRLLEELGVGALAHQLGEPVPVDARMQEDGVGERGEERGELLLPDVDMPDILGEAIEQEGMMGKCEDDGDGETMRRWQRPRHAPSGLRTSRGRRRRALLAVLAPKRPKARFGLTAIVLAHATVGNRLEQAFETLLKGRAPLGCVEAVGRAFATPQHIDERAALRRDTGLARPALRCERGHPGLSLQAERRSERSGPRAKSATCDRRRGPQRHRRHGRRRSR